MLVVLPLISFGVLFLLLLPLQSRPARISGLRIAFLEAAALWGGFVALATEGLSLLHALNPTGIAALWATSLLALLGIALRKGRLLQGARLCRDVLRSLDRLEWMIAAGFSLILGALLLVAFLAPANTSDSLQYHMTRVMHWAQNQSLRHYATSFSPQLYNPIWAEEVILHFRQLWGNDRLANLVQWFSMVGSLAGVSLLAGLMGASRKGQMAAAAFALSLPMGLLQATSTQNDYVVAFWLICLLSMTVLSITRPLTKLEFLCASLVLGLGLLTKGTFYPYALPVLLWFFLVQLRRHNWRKTFGRGSLMASTVLLLNLGYWLRNVLTFGTPLGPIARIKIMTASHHHPLSVISAILRNILLNFVTPYENLNLRVADWLRATFGAFDPSLANLQFFWGWNHNDMAGNPLHVILFLLAVLLFLVLHRKYRNQLMLQTLLMLGALFLMLTLVVKDDLWGNRYQLPFWVACSPFFGAVLSGLDRRILPPLATLALLLASLPWVLFNRTRPLIAMKDVRERYTIPCYAGCTAGSILHEPETAILFANWTQLRQPYLSMSEDLLASGCSNVGLRIDSHDPEYFFWYLLDAPQSGIRLENVNPLPELERYQDPTFSPCAVICTLSGDLPQVHGLPIFKEYGEIKLYLE